jgi:hypothetical protein
MEDTDEISTGIYSRIRHRYEETASLNNPAGNIVGAFFHDLMVHFTGIIIHRNTIGDYGEGISFPWVNREYSLKPFELTPPKFTQNKSPGGLKKIIRSTGLLSVAVGHSIPISGGSGSYREKVLKILLSVSENEKLFIPQYDSQVEVLKGLVSEICHEFQIPNETQILRNWVQHLLLHTTRTQKIVSKNGVLIGTRNNLENRKLALNFLQQGKQVVAFTHGELSNHIFDEPVYSYSDRALCTTLIEYGEFSPKTIGYRPIIPPKKEIRRASELIEKYFSPDSAINIVNLNNAKVLLIPTIYQENYLYGPKRSYETLKYYEWHKTLDACISGLTVKVHPKTRFRPKFRHPVELRPLEKCIPEYDLLVFDFIASGVALALFSNKPIIYFDIGLRKIDPRFKMELACRGSIYEIDFNQNWDVQVREALEKFQETDQIFSNLGLARFSLVRSKEYSIWQTILDIIRD